MKSLPYFIALLLCFASFTASSQSDVSQDDSRLSETTFSVVEQMPEYPGCESVLDNTARKNCAYKNMIKYISDNLVYPSEAKAAKLEGTVVVSLIVDKEGAITKTQVVKGFDPACEAEALRVINEMPNWKPGMMRDRPVAVSMNLPIRFSL